MIENKEVIDRTQEIIENNKTKINIDDDHEDKSSYTSEFKSSKVRAGYQAEVKAIKESLKDEYDAAQKSYDEFLSKNPSASEEEKNEAKENCFKEVNDKFCALEKPVAEKYAEEIKYHIHPKLGRKEELIGSDILLSVRHLKQFFFFGSKLHNMKLKAVSNVSFDVKKGECFGIVGESGCGKTTTGRTIIKLYNPTSGSIYYRGYRIGAGSRWNEKEIKWKRIKAKNAIADLKNITNKQISLLNKEDADYLEKKNALLESCNKQIAEIKAETQKIVKEQKEKIAQIKFDQNHTPRKLMNEIQMIFQDPVDSLDPRMTVEDIIQEGMLIQGKTNKEENHKKVVEMLEKVGLVEEHASRYPHEFSGGQRQRIGIARALVMNPKLLICDEPISALDVSIRAQIINLLNDLKEEMGLTLIFIAHDLSVVKYFCDRIAVMYYGKLVELASSDELFKHPLHPYTKSLLSAIPKPNPLTERKRVRILYNPATAHDYSRDLPTLKEVVKDHFVYCNDAEFIDYQNQIKDEDEKAK